jgi:hypothetical protein
MALRSIELADLDAQTAHGMGEFEAEFSLEEQLRAQLLSLDDPEVPIHQKIATAFELMKPTDTDPQISAVYGHYFHSEVPLTVTVGDTTYQDVWLTFRERAGAYTASVMVGDRPAEDMHGSYSIDKVTGKLAYRLGGLLPPDLAFALIDAGIADMTYNTLGISREVVQPEPEAAAEAFLGNKYEVAGQIIEELLEDHPGAYVSGVGDGEWYRRTIDLAVKPDRYQSGRSHLVEQFGHHSPRTGKFVATVTFVTVTLPSGAVSFELDSRITKVSKGRGWRDASVGIRTLDDVFEVFSADFAELYEKRERGGADYRVVSHNEL